MTEQAPFTAGDRVRYSQAHLERSRGMWTKNRMRVGTVVRIVPVRALQSALPPPQRSDKILAWSVGVHWDGNKHPVELPHVFLEKAPGA